MPTFHDALAPASLALAAAIKPVRAGAESLGCFESISAVALAQLLGESGARSVPARLAEHGLLEPDCLASAGVIEIRDAFGLKNAAPAAKAAAALKHLARWWLARDEAGAWAAAIARASVSAGALESLRAELLELSGIGTATADAILLFGLGLPTYPIDRATFRILVRHGWLDATASYDEARETVVDAARTRADATGSSHVHVLISLSDNFARIGAGFCRAAAPRCAGCPLEKFLPEGGPYDDHG